MTNYENQKAEIDTIIKRGICIAVNKSTKKVVLCPEIACAECLFFKRGSAGCGVRMMEWLVAEYVEPEIDWSKVPVDTPVLVSDNNRDWYHRHLAKVVENQPYIWGDGRTSWTTDGNDVLYKYIKLAEVE